MRTKTFGEKLKDLLYEKKVSQTDLSKKLGIHKQVLSNWITGHRHPKQTNLEKIAKALNIPAGDLLDDKFFLNVNSNSKGTVNQSNSASLFSLQEQLQMLQEKLSIKEEKIKFLEEKIKFLESKQK